MPQRFRVDDEHRPLHVGAEFHIRPEKSAAASAFPGRAMLAPTDRFPRCSLLTDVHSPIILQPPLQFRLVGYKNALLQG